SDCKIEGAYGGIPLEEAVFYPFEQSPSKVPAEFRIKGLKPQPLVEALNRKVLPTVIAKLGSWSGHVRCMNKNVWSVDGLLESMEVVFSNQSVRGKQLIRKIRTKVEKVEGLIAARLDQVQIVNGEFDGALEFQLADDWRSGS